MNPSVVKQISSDIVKVALQVPKLRCYSVSHSVPLSRRSITTPSSLGVNCFSNQPVIINLNLRDNLCQQTTWRGVHLSCNMTNKPRTVSQQNNNQLNNGIKSLHSNATAKPIPVHPSYTLAHSPNFRNMAGIQKLATESTREHIENIRHVLSRMNAKNNDDQEITMVKDHETGIATVCIKSAAKNGISGKMMCDFLDIVDELYSWNEGKGVIIHGHKGFFCSGELVCYNWLDTKLD